MLHAMPGYLDNGTGTVIKYKNRLEADIVTTKAKESVKYSLATHAAEKMTPSRKAVRLCEKIAEGHISGDSAVEQIKHSYGIKSGHPNV